MGDTEQKFELTTKQDEALEVIAESLHSMLYGGSRSGKTFLLVYIVVTRAIAMTSRHLIVRFRFNHVKRSIWYDTFPKVMKICYPEIVIKPNKSDWYIEFPHNGSQIWLGGIDDKERTEQILGNEYSTIYMNECSQISYEAVLMLQTRLAELSGLTPKFFYDCNPPSKKHWTYSIFKDLLEPNDKGSLNRSMYGSLIMNPKDNLGNISKGYMDILRGMPARMRKRFLEGEFLSDIEGALWSMDMITFAQMKEYGEIEETVVSVDPSVSNEEGDLCGITVCSRDEFGEGVVEADLSMQSTTQAWAQAVVDAYYEYEANYVVAESNQGGELVRDVINNIDPNIKVFLIHAKKGKFSRAEPIAQLYEQGKVAHEEGLNDLETEMQEFVRKNSKGSPNRMDSAVYGLMKLLMNVDEYEPMIRVA